jgi:hypothetical protein
MNPPGRPPVSRAEPSKAVLVRLPASVCARLKALASYHGQSVPGVIRQLVERSSDIKTRQAGETLAP